LSEAAVSGSVEARANLCLYMNLDLQDMLLVKGVINGSLTEGVEEYKERLLEDAFNALDNQDICGFIALSAIAGYYPPPEKDPRDA
jgi:hypothetical protein